MDVKVSHCFSRDPLSADMVVTEALGWAVAAAPKPPPPAAFFLGAFLAKSTVIAVLGEDIDNGNLLEMPIAGTSDTWVCRIGDNDGFGWKDIVAWKKDDPTSQ